MDEIVAKCDKPHCFKKAEYVVTLGTDSVDAEQEFNSHRCRDCLAGNIARNELTKSEVATLRKL